ncbi:hypothetical protein [Antarctobacter jejuensis]|uniref:hypothetical protein n=1 Tax=Antarctobacter jejuensis TaxID=1439938 RepID=UPI003FD18E82
MNYPGALAGATGAECPIQATAEGLSRIPEMRAQRQHHAIAEADPGVVANLDGRWPVVVCKDFIQWSLRRKDAQKAGRAVRMRIDRATLAAFVTLPNASGAHDGTSANQTSDAAPRADRGTGPHNRRADQGDRQ